MRGLYKIILAYFIVLLPFSINKGLAQDPHFSQFYANPLYLAPSFAGTSKLGSRISLNYREQWPNIPRAYSTYSGSFDHYYPKIKSGVGLLLMNNVEGSAHLRNLQAAVFYAYDIKVSDILHIRPGLNFQYITAGYDFNKFRFYEQLESGGSPTTIAPFEQVSAIDMAFSVLSYSELVWFGFTMNHLLKPSFNFWGNSNPNNYFYNMKYSVFGGKRIRLRSNLLKYYKEHLTVSFLYEQQESYKQLNLGASYNNNPLMFGFWYRGIPWIKSPGNPGHDSFVFLVGYMVNEAITLGYSYDLTVSGLDPSSGGAHEISLVWNFKLRPRAKKPTALPCPHL